MSAFSRLMKWFLLIAGRIGLAIFLMQLLLSIGAHTALGAEPPGGARHLVADNNPQYIPRFIPPLAVASACCPIPWAADAYASATIPVAEALMSRYRESGAVAVRPMSEVHLRLSLARPVALDPIVTVREAGRFTLINTKSGLLKLTNADSERRRLVQRPGLCLCRRD